MAGLARPAFGFARVSLPVALAGAAFAASALAAPSSAALDTRALRTSRSLWATIDVCAPKDQPDTVGVRGSMPGDGRARDRMYMSFRLQYLNDSGSWSDLAAGASRHYVFAGGGGTARQDGRSFRLSPVAGMPAAMLRGVVDFQWRRGSTVLLSLSRPTTAGHMSLAGADPAGFSAARCQLG